MSTIDEALKKAEKERDSNQKKEKASPNEPPVINIIRQEKTKSNIPKYGIEKAPVSSGREHKSLLVPTISLTAVTLLLIYGLFILLREKPAAKYAFDKPAYLGPAVEDSNSKGQPAPVPSAEAVSDVTAKTKTQAAQTPEFYLSGIIRGEGSPMAIINGEVFLVGDTVRNAEVVEILDDMVLLRKESRIIELKAR